MEAPSFRGGVIYGVSLVLESTLHSIDVEINYFIT